MEPPPPPSRPSRACFAPEGAMSVETSACLALKDLNLGENKEMIRSKKDPKLSVADAGSVFKPVAKTRRRKKVMLRMGNKYVVFLEQHPPSPRSELHDSFIAEEKAEREERERIIKLYKDRGYAEEKEFSDDEDEEL